jgi:nickel-dependent lactate racemase
MPEGLPVKLLKGKPLPAVPDVAAALRQGFADPFGRPPLRPKDNPATATVIVGDYTRNNAYKVWLPLLLDELNRAGITDKGIALYIGNGTHRPMTQDEMQQCYGEAVLKRVQVQLHDADATDRMKKIGRTDRGTIVEIDQRVADASLLVLTGGITYHYFAGYSGGRKAVMPGCASRSTILKNHSLALEPAKMDFHPHVRPGILVGNPVNEDMEQAVSAVKPDMCVNVILNDDKEIAWLGVGDFAYVLRNGAKFLDEHSKLPVRRKAHIAVVGSGGHPKDLTLFQSHKGLKHLAGVLQPGAKVVWLARCADGEGHEKFQAFREMPLEDVKAKVQREVGLYSFCSLSLKTLARLHEIHFVSELPPEHVRAWGMHPHPDLNSAMAAVVPPKPEQHEWIIAPDMSNKLAVFKPLAEEKPT